MAIVRNSISGSSGGSDIIVVANYSALPDPTTVSGKFYWVSNSQGTKWLPGSLGGTYYNSGLYYSNGTTWEFMNVPYQATQVEVDAGTNTDKFLTPKTFNDSAQLASKANDSAVVHNAGNETIAGEKTFTSVITAPIFYYIDGVIYATSGDTYYTNAAGKTHYFGGGIGGVQNNLSVANGTFNIALQTANTIASFDAFKNIVSLNPATYPSLTELIFVKGVTSAIQTQIDARQNLATATTGAVISFATPQIYNTVASPATGNITNNLTGAKIGTVQKVYHQSGSAPTVPAGWVKLGSGTYSTTLLNIIYCEWVSGSRVEYWITQ